MFYSGSSSTNVGNGGSHTGGVSVNVGNGGSAGGSGDGGDKPHDDKRRKNDNAYDEVPICPIHLDQEEGGNQGGDSNSNRRRDGKSASEVKEEALYRHLAMLGPDGRDQDGDRLVIRNCTVCGYPVLYKVI